MAQKSIGPTFGPEVAAAGLLGLPFSWSPDGTIGYDAAMTEAQIAAVQAVYEAHDPLRQAATATLLRSARIIAPLAFRRRMGPARGRITVAAAQAMRASPPDATLQVMLDDLASTKFVDLDDPEIAAGVASLVAAGLLTQEQGEAMLVDAAPGEEP